MITCHLPNRGNRFLGHISPEDRNWEKEGAFVNTKSWPIPVSLKSSSSFCFYHLNGIYFEHIESSEHQELLFWWELPVFLSYLELFHHHILFYCCHIDEGNSTYCCQLMLSQISLSPYQSLYSKSLNWGPGR